MPCLLKEKIIEFKNALKKRHIKIEDLLNMSTEERTKLLEEYAGTNAKDVNLLFEQKLVLKNKLLGIKNWASKVGEIGRYDPAKKAEINKATEEFKKLQEKRMFSPEENEAFLNDLVDKKLGTHITQEEAKIMFETQKKADKLFESYNPTTEEWSSEKTKADYGATKQILKRYTENLKTGNLPIKGMFRQYGREITELWKENKFEATQKVIGNSISNLSKTMINAVASWDNSFLGRQGAITLTKSPKTWWHMAKKSMSDFYRTLKGSNPEDVLMAEIYSDPDYINGNYAKAKLSFGVEEEVPIQVLERIPFLGKIFKASDIAFIDSAIRARRGLFKIQKNVYEKRGIPLDKAILEDMGTVINAITARGKVGRIGASAPVQILMWAPRMLKADWDILTAHTFGFGLKTNIAREQAVKTIVGVVVATAAITAIAEAMGADVEKDPTSTDFLKIKVGNTRINSPFARGMPQIVTLFARLITQETKSSYGIKRKLNTGEFGSRTLFDIGVDFLVNKTTPPAGAVLSWFRGRDFAGRKPTIGRTAFGFLPISVQNFIELKDEATTASVLGAFADLFGVSVNTYARETDWGQNTGAEILQFREKVGEKRFKEANESYNKRVDNWFNSIKATSKFLTLSDKERQSVITKKKGVIKDKIFKDYFFVYKRKKSKKLPKF